jgi:tetratricopeptide (TPR) repeat protein
VAVSDDALQAYVDAPTIEEAERALDELQRRHESLPVQLGDLYDELAEAAAEDDDAATAARLERKAIDAGCRHPLIAREMLAWYLLKAGSRIEGEAHFAELRRERPNDARLIITLGHARSDAGFEDDALAAFDAAVAVAKRAGDRPTLDRARTERRAEREHVGLPPDEDDRLAPTPRPMHLGPWACAVAWFPPERRASALARWPSLADDFADPRAYARRIENHLREIHRTTGQRPQIAPIDPEVLTDWAATKDYDADSGAARSQFAAELARTGRAEQWPPGRNDACWCRSGRKYKRCCGAQS